MVRFPVIESVDQEGAAAAGGGGGTSAVPPGWFQPETYGAKGDNSTDDTVAINAAITAAKTARGVVYFSSAAGYKFSGPLKLDLADVMGFMGPQARGHYDSGVTLTFTGGNAAITTLAAAIVVTTRPVTITTSAPAPAALGDGGFRIKIDTESFWVTSGASGTSWVCQGEQDQVHATHLNGASVLPDFAPISCKTVAGLTIQNLRFVYSNPTFDRHFLNSEWIYSGGDSSQIRLHDCTFRGITGGAIAATSLVRFHKTIISTIEGCHFGEHNHQAIMLGEFVNGNSGYAVGIQVRDNTFNSGNVGTHSIQTFAGCESILIEANTFEPIAGNNPGAWLHTGNGVGFHITFRDNWMGDVSVTGYYIRIDGATIQSWDISNNRFTNPGKLMLLINNGLLSNGKFTGNYCDAGGTNVIDVTVGDGSGLSGWVFGNYPTPVVNGSPANLAVTEGPSLAFHPYAISSSAPIGFFTSTPAYGIDVESSAVRLRAGSLVFGGTQGNVDGDLQLLRAAAGVLAIGQSGGGLRLTSPNGLVTKTLSIDNTGALIVT